MVHVSTKPLAKANASGFVDYCKRLHFFMVCESSICLLLLRKVLL